METSYASNTQASTVGGGGGGNLSQWVSHVQQQHSGTGDHLSSNAFQTPSGGGVLAQQSTGASQSAAHSADALEEEVLRAREQRLKRRSQLGTGAGTGGGGASAAPTPLLGSSRRENQAPASVQTPATPQLSGEETLRKLMGERGLTSPSLVPSTISPPSHSSPTMKSNALLDRYGGAMGPTGVAKPGADHESPVSLASFMGGKASGPRLGKLAGDGRSAPPEAGAIHESRHALPGLSQNRYGSATPLANFLEARASGKASTSPLPAASMPSPVSSPSPAKYSYVPPKLSSSPPKMSSATFVKPKTIPGGSTSPSRPLSPIRTPNAGSAHAPINIPDTQIERQAAFGASRKDASTSPTKADDPRRRSPDLSARPELGTNATTPTIGGALSPGSIVHSPTADAIARFPDISHSLSPATSPKIPQEPQEHRGMSAAFLATQQSNDRMPTASLTRLRSKKMVEQRIREAQERNESQDSHSSSSPARSPMSPDSGGYADAGTARSTLPSAPARSPLPSPGGIMSNALPGMSARHAGSGAPSMRNLYAVNRKTPEEEAAAHAAPVRLPGMGGAASPFGAAKMTAEVASEEDRRAAAGTLEPLVKGRAKPKKSTTSSQNIAAQAKRAFEEDVGSPSLESEQISRDAFASARQAFGGEAGASTTAFRSASPVKSTPGLNIETQGVRPAHAARTNSTQSGGGPDSAARIADSTAALEALLEGRKVSTPPPQERPIPAEKLVRRSGTLKIAKNHNNVKMDSSVLNSDASSSTSLSSVANNRKTIALDVYAIQPDGSTRPLHGKDASTLFETDTLVIVHRFKETATSAVISTKLYARVGRLSSVVNGSDSLEAGKVMELAQSHRVPVIDARQGRESGELAKVLGGELVTREGSRKDFNDPSTPARSMYQVHGHHGSLFIDQVDALTGSLSSALSVVAQMAANEVFVWHGRGAIEPIRAGAVRFAQSLCRSHVQEVEEGQEPLSFWKCFERDVPYSNAWHHRFLPRLRPDQHNPRLFGIQSQGSMRKMTELSPFSAIDVRRDGVYVLQLPLELYVLVGPDARSQRQSIAAMIEAASTVSRKQSQQRGPYSMTMPVHVVVFPTLVPREVRSAFRYWHDDHLNGKRWQRMQLRMNVWERREAQEQLNRNEYNLDELDDDLFLPVGVGLDDIRGLDI